MAMKKRAKKEKNLLALNEAQEVGNKKLQLEQKNSEFEIVNKDVKIYKDLILLHPELQKSIKNNTDKISSIEKDLEIYEKISNSQYFTLSDLKDFFTNTNLFSQSDFQGNGISDEGKLFFEGGTNLIENNTSDIMNIINRVKLFNNPNDLRNVFSQFLQMEEFKDGEVNVIFGEDLKIAGLEDFSFVFSVYTLNNARGIIGVIGPKRMEYSKTVGLVEYVAEEVNQLLNQKNKQ